MQQNTMEGNDKPNFEMLDYLKQLGYNLKDYSSNEKGFDGYIAEHVDQYVIFHYNPEKDLYTISQLGGYKLDKDEAIAAGMRQRGHNQAGLIAYFTDGNYTPTPITMDALKKIAEHVITGLDREAEAQREYYTKF